MSSQSNNASLPNHKVLAFPVLPSEDADVGALNRMATQLNQWQAWLSFLSMFQTLKQHWTPEMAGVRLLVNRDRDDPDCLQLDVRIQWQDGKQSDVTAEEKSQKNSLEMACHDQLHESNFSTINDIFALRTDGRLFFSLEEIFSEALFNQPEDIQAAIREIQLEQAWAQPVSSTTPKPRF